jgi:hypothetical protein
MRWRVQLGINSTSDVWKLFEEMRRIDLSWNIGQVCFKCLMFMNFVALI